MNNLSTNMPYFCNYYEKFTISYSSDFSSFLALISCSISSEFACYIFSILAALLQTLQVTIWDLKLISANTPIITVSFAKAKA